MLTTAYIRTMSHEPNTNPPDTRRRPRWSLARMLLVVTFIALSVAHGRALWRLNRAENELTLLRRETGFLEASTDEQIAAVRMTSDEILTYRLRVRVPQKPEFRVAYSTVWPQDSSHPLWFAAVDLPPGESIVTVRVHEDPRDDRWKITTIVRSEVGTKRIATTLPPDQIAVFRGSHDAISMGVGRDTFIDDLTHSIRLLDERWVVGEGGLLLYGDRPPARDQIGIYAELQVDDQPL